MDIHTKINAKMRNYIRLYILWGSGPHIVASVTQGRYMPKHLKYGGWRNTCYDYRA